jgi:hypothetical protein
MLNIINIVFFNLNSEVCEIPFYNYPFRLSFILDSLLPVFFKCTQVVDEPKQFSSTGILAVTVASADELLSLTHGIIMSPTDAGT